MASVKSKDKLFGAKVVELGYMSEAELQKVYAEITDSHTSLSGLRDVLETKGHLTAEKSRAVERSLNGGQQIAGYELLEKVGQGGMGAVFRARQISMDRIVALKILPPKLAKDKKFCERFIMEARASGGLNHINIIQGIDVGESQGHYYFAMEYVDGCTVKDLLDDQGKLPEALALQICRQMADALDHAHQNKLVHRDIKPDNIMLANLPDDWKEQSEQGKLTLTAKLCDLGLARSVSGGSDDLKGVAVGTPHFIAPEQARGETDVDTRADIYSLGASLYNMLTAKTLFTAKSSRDVMMMHLTEQAPDPNEIEGVEVSENTLRVMEKMLAKDRNDRYETPKQLSEDLAGLIAGRKPVYTKGFSAKSSLAVSAKLRKGETTRSERVVRNRSGTGKHASVRVGVSTEKVAPENNTKIFIIGGVVAAIFVVGIVLVSMHGTPKPAVKPPVVSNNDPENPAPVPTPSDPHPTPIDVQPVPTPSDPTPHVTESPRDQLDREGRAAWEKVSAALGDDPAKNVAALREVESTVKGSKDAYKLFSARLDQDLGKWRVTLAEEWKTVDAAADGLIKLQKFEGARDAVNKADPKFKEAPNLAQDTLKKIHDRENDAVDQASKDAGKLIGDKNYPAALALLDPAGRTNFSDEARKKLGDYFNKAGSDYRTWQVLDAANNLDQHEAAYEKALESVNKAITDTSGASRIQAVRKALRDEAAKKENLLVADWLALDLKDADNAAAAVQAANAFLAKTPATPVYRIADDKRRIPATITKVGDGKLTFKDAEGEFNIEAALGSSQIAAFAGLLNDSKNPAKVLTAAILAMALGEFDKADMMLATLPANIAEHAYRRLAILAKQPDDEKQLRRQLDSISLLIQAAKFDDAAKKFDDVDAAAGLTPAGLKYAARLMEIRLAIKNKGYPDKTPGSASGEVAPAPATAAAEPVAPGVAPAVAAPVVAAAAPSGSPARKKLTVDRGAWCDIYENVKGLPSFPDFDQLKPAGSEVLPQIDFGGKFANRDLKENMALRLTGLLVLRSGGRFQLRLTCDDGARLSLSEAKKPANAIHIEDASDHTMRATVAEGIDLPSGNHEFTIDFFNHYGGGGLRLEWIPPGAKDWAAVPADAIGHYTD